MKNKIDKSCLLAHPQGRRYGTAITVFIILVLFLIQMIMRFSNTIGPDNAWYIYVANGILQGKTLYKDFLEPNPPLGLWLTLPMVWLAKLSAVKAQTVVFLFFFTCTAGCLALCNKYLSLVPSLPTPLRFVLIIGLCIILLCVPGYSFGQREHLLILFFLPWVIVRFARYEGSLLRDKVWWIGVLAAVGFCLKPQYLLAPVLVEVYISTQIRSFRNISDPENLAALVTLCCYPLLMWFFAPQFFQFLPLILAAYPYFSKTSFVDCLKFISPSGVIYLLLFISVRFSSPPLSKLIFFSLAAATGFLVGYFIQSKGFMYHLIPFLVMTGFGCSVFLCDLGRRIGPHIKRLSGFDWVVLCGSLFFIYVSGVIFILALSPQIYPGKDGFIKESLRRFAPQAKSLYIASADILAFPYVVKKNKIWTSRSPSEWFVPYVIAKTKDNPNHEDALVTQIRDWMVTDLIEQQPEIILVNISPQQVFIPGGYFDYIKFWSKDQRFKQMWDNYQLRSTDGKFAVYTRVE